MATENLGFEQQTVTWKLATVHLVVHTLVLFIAFTLVKLGGPAAPILGAGAVALMVFSYWYVVGKYENRDVSELKLGILAPRTRFVFLIILIGVIAVTLATLFVKPHFDLKDLGSSQSRSSEELQFVFQYVFLVPIFEEIVFRGVVSRWLVGHFSVSSSMVIQSLLFVGMHSLNAPFSSGDPLLTAAFFVFCFFGGISFFLLQYATGSLLFPIAAHVAWNTGAYSVSKLSDLAYNGQTYVELHLYVGAVFWTVLAIVLWTWVLKKHPSV